MHYDVIIVGAGPIGLACGIESVKNGYSHLILDKGMLVNSIYHYPSNMTFFSTSSNIEIGDVPFISHTPKPTRREALEYYRRATQSWKLNVCLYESVSNIEKQEDSGSFKITTSKAQYTASKIILCTGFFDRENRLNVPGEELPKVAHYYKEAHPYFNQKVLIIGAANSAVDVALETFRTGAREVTMVMRESEIQSSVKYWVRPDIVNRIEEGSIKAYFESEVLEIREKEVVIKTPKEEVTLENDFVLAMTGYLPDYDFLSKIGIAIGDDEFKTPIYDSSTHESSIPGLYLAGVVCGGLKTNKWYIENSREHALKIMDALMA